MEYKLSFMCFFMLANYNLSLKLSELCINSQNSICEGEYNQDCGTNYCTIDLNSCNRFLSLTYSLRKFRNSVNHGQQNNAFKIFLKKIENCQIKKYTWQLNDICIKKKKCLQKKRIPLRTGDSYLVKQVDCNCRGELSYKCLATDFCTLHKHACLKFAQEIQKNSSMTFKKIKYCL